LLNDTITALTLLTRLPVAGFNRSGAPDIARSVWAFPVVGLIVGFLGGIAYALACWIGMAPLLAASWTLVAMLLITGAFHEDGLADTADGFGGGQTRERKLEIMRDSRIGTYGAAALVLSLIVRVTALASFGHARHAVAALIVAGLVGRGAIVLVLLLLRPARSDGMAAALDVVPESSFMLGLALTVIAPFFFLSAGCAFLAVALGFGLAFAMSRLAYVQIGGHSGDMLGAVEIVVECAVISLIAAVLA
jgi:adenosylcobinamide-GDP ribazoletransferase